MSGDLPQYLRAEGAVLLRCEPAADGRTVAARVRQKGALNVRFPRGGGLLEAVIVNIAGGVAAGDRHAVDIAVASGADLVVSTPAAEKIYRSPGAVARIDVTLDVAGGLAWLPQETILFDQAKLARRLHATMTEGASLLIAEMMVLGRTAMGEQVKTGLLRDEWRIKREGRLIYADALRLEEDIAAQLARRAVTAGAPAFATILYAAPDAMARLDAARAEIDKVRSDACDVAASAWDGMLALRWLARDARIMRAAVGRFLEAFRGAALPRVWMT